MMKVTRVETGGVEEPAGASTAASRGVSWQLIHEALHDAVARHRLKPGAKIVEEEVAALFGVSRTVVRAAIQALARDGILVVERNKGARVARPSPEDARGIFEARELIEPRLAQLAAERMLPADATRLRACIESEHRALEADRPRDAVFLSAEFHRIVAALSGHPVLEGILADLLARSSLVIALYWRAAPGACRNHAHLALADALAAGESEAAARLMQAHVAALLGSLDFTAGPGSRSELAEALSVPRGS